MMQHSEKLLSVVWRGKTFLLEMDQCAKLKDLGDRLQKLTNIKIDTLRLIVPAKKGSKLLYPFSDEHSNLPLEAVSTLEGKSIRMMGVPENEVDEVLQSVKTDLRIAGFDEEEKRMRQRAFYDHNSVIQLPQGTYVFSEFRTLSLPGVELNPPASEALKLMHRLAADPGIVAVMNKHRWRVGIMTEMAPVGYVGVSPKCILGFNKNQGEEISLRLRTDDLRGFRKYESIKNTLLHELTHMVFSEHDANFYALNKQLTKEATALDWTKSKGHTLNGVRPALHYDQEYGNNVSLSQKLGGQESGFSTARASSVAAAYSRFAEISNAVRALGGSEEPDQGCSHTGMKTEIGVTGTGSSLKSIQVHEAQENEIGHHPDHNDRDAVESESCSEFDESHISSLPDHDCLEGLKTEENELQASDTFVLPSKDSGTMEIDGNSNQPKVISVEPDPDDSHAGDNYAKFKKMVPHQEATVVLMDLPYREPDPDESHAGDNYAKFKKIEPHQEATVELMDLPYREPDPDDSEVSIVVEREIEPDDNGMVIDEGMSMDQADEPDPDDQELHRIQDPAKAVYSRLQKAMDMLRSEVNPLDVAAVLQTLLKIIRNVIEHPNELKFKKIRKANPTIQRNIVRYGAAGEMLHLVGFSEDVMVDEVGKAEAYLVLKRNDPGLLWLVKSSLESCNA